MSVNINATNLKKNDIFPIFQNGRVTNVMETITPSFPLYENLGQKTDTFKKTALQGIQVESPLSVVYFSPENIENIQQKLRYLVWLRSGKKFVIGKQDELELKIVMRSIDLQYSRNLQYDIAGQVEQLNQLVLEWCIPKVITEVQQYLYYLDSIQHQPTEIELPKNLSSKGDRILPSVTNSF